MGDKRVDIQIAAKYYGKLEMLAEDQRVEITDIVEAAIRNYFCWQPIHEDIQRIIAEERAPYYVEQTT